MSEVEKLLDAKAELGEGPVWDSENGEVLWVDIMKGEINRVDLEGNTKEPKHIQAPVGSIARTLKGDLIAATPSGLINADNGNSVAEFPKLNSNLRMNDGKADPIGRFIGGTMSLGEPERNAGSLWSFSDKAPKILLEGVTISNGLGWSEDGSKMFYIDTPTQRVDSFDYDLESGEISNRKTFAEIPTTLGAPDGMCIDSEGGIWVALWGGGAIIRILQGEVVEKVHVPTPQVTCVAFVGPDLDQLVITTASIGLEDGLENAGDLFVYSPSVNGRASYLLGDWAS